MPRHTKAADTEAAERVADMKALADDDTQPTEPIAGRPAEPDSIGHQLLGPGAIETPTGPGKDQFGMVDGRYYPVTDGTSLVRANGSSSGADRDRKYAELIKIVHGAETLRFDAQTTVGLETELDAASDLLAQARAQEANREHVSPEILRQLKNHSDRVATQLESWLLQRGVKDEQS